MGKAIIHQLLVASPLYQPKGGQILVVGNTQFSVRLSRLGSRPGKDYPNPPSKFFKFSVYGNLQQIFLAALNRRICNF